MCGIAGVLTGPEARPDRDALVRVTRAMRARGPDGEGFYTDGPLGLGHRRLAVIDLAGGAQPLVTAGGQVVGVVNGEIYNAPALRAELAACGQIFATASDSEVAVCGFAAWGERVLERIEGQFALALWDARRRTLLLARDRAGEKPLFYALLPGGTLAFASELKALALYPGVDRGIEPGALARFLLHEHVPAPWAMLRGARKLEPGQALRIRPGQPPQLLRYWDIPIGAGAGAPGAGTAGALVAELRAEIERAVRDRLVADVRLGVFLSGGLDSSLVAVHAARARPRIDTFSIGFADPSHDESHHARRVARLIGSRHHEHRVTAAELLGLVPGLGELMDEPLGDSSLLPTHILSRFARGQVTVALGGDGGDEFFAGYPTFLAEAWLGRPLDALPRWARRGLHGALTAAVAALPSSAGYLSTDFVLRQLARGLPAPGPAARHQAWLAAFLPGELRSLLHPDLASALADDPLDDTIRARAARAGDRSPCTADQLLYLYARGYLGDGVLTKVDRASMAVSLEVRAPLLDRRIMALAAGAPARLRLRHRIPKWLLRQAARGLLPDDLIDRRKHGFAMPVAAWLRGELRDLLLDTLAPRRLRQQGWLRPAAVQELLHRHLSGRADHRKQLWTLLCLQSWLDRRAELASAVTPEPRPPPALEPPRPARRPDTATR
jgi:asparagine synthase (glutamine-hydrolysing)